MIPVELIAARCDAVAAGAATCPLQELLAEQAHLWRGEDMGVLRDTLRAVADAVINRLRGIIGAPAAHRPELERLRKDLNTLTAVFEESPDHDITYLALASAIDETMAALHGGGN